MHLGAKFNNYKGNIKLNKEGMSTRKCFEKIVHNTLHYFCITFVNITPNPMKLEQKILTTR